MMYDLAPSSFKSCFEALQYGHQDLLKTAGEGGSFGWDIYVTDWGRVGRGRTDGVVVDDALGFGLCGGHGGVGG